jgi:hypothetical protein
LKHHPDRGGSSEDCARINAAGERVLQRLQRLQPSSSYQPSSSSAARTEVEMTPQELQEKIAKQESEAQARIARMMAADELDERARETKAMDYWDHYARKVEIATKEMEREQKAMASYSATAP